MSETSLADVTARIGAVFSRDLQLEPPDPDTDLFDVGVLDSLSFVTLLAGLEREFHIHIPVDRIELDLFASIGSMARFISANTTESDDAEPVELRN